VAISTTSRKRSRDIARDGSREHWSGGTWVYYDIVTNPGAAAGSQHRDIITQPDSDLEFLYGSWFNGDAQARNFRIWIETENDNDEIITEIANSSLGGNARGNFPWAEDTNTVGIAAGARILLGGGMIFHGAGTSISANEETIMAVVFRLRGVKPTVRYTLFAAGATEEDNVEVVVNRVY